MGLLLVAFAPHHLFAVAGIALWGIGSALGFSLGISALSVDPVMTPARVSVLSTVNYGAALIGPPLLGLIADHIGYHRALAFVALPILLANVLAGQVPDRRGTMAHGPGVWRLDRQRIRLVLAPFFGDLVGVSWWAGTPVTWRSVSLR